MKEETYDMLVKRCVEKHGYNVAHLHKVPQKWTQEIPDDLLVCSDQNN